MQLAQGLDTLPHRVWGKRPPGRTHLAQFKLRFAFDRKLPTSALEGGLTREQMIAASKARWFAAVGLKRSPTQADSGGIP